MKKLLIVLIGLLFSFASLEASAFEQRLQVGELSGVVTAEKPISVGKNVFTLGFKKRSECLIYAKVVAHISTKALDGQDVPEISQKVPARYLGGGKYTFTTDLAKKGTWYVDLVVTPALGAAKHVKTTFTF